jgi:hypothetical protein
MNERSSVATGHGSSSQETPATHSRVVTDEDYQMAAKNAGKRQKYEALKVAAFFLLTRRRFRRLWVLQESRKARRTVFFLGDFQSGAEIILSIVQWAHEHVKTEKEYTMVEELRLYPFPSWVPDPTAWTSRVLEPVIGLNNTNILFFYQHIFRIRD